MRKFSCGVVLVLMLFMLAACGVQKSSSSAGVQCPTDGSTFAYGSCTLPAAVLPVDVPVISGAPSKIMSLCGSLVVRPASYTLNEGSYVCM